ncbi:PorT family protein [Flavobacteriaceae bacterium F89]|uniref:PorT family protein n=1 Tax=Cerina litoralis TaxID=2874477 RepID=A0AAE3JNW2_9FLAO|nr:porin family protein [Cerina litoralis]MCG2460169.1 PorT family protein [Cerina litoralis]
MRKLSLFIVFCLLFTSIYAQVKVRPGIKMGINNSEITNSYLDPKTGIYVGGFASIQFNKRYTLQPELLYSQQGGNGNSRAPEDLNIQYISIGLANKFFVSPNIGFHLVLGPTLDINAENSAISVINGNGDLDKTPIDFAFFGGVGYEFPFGLVLEARYKQGLLDVELFNQEGEYVPNYSENHLNSVFQIGAAYKFEF